MRRVLRLLLSVVLFGLLGAGAVAHAQGGCDLNDAEALAGRADVRFHNGLYDAAVADYTCAIALSPDDPSLYIGRADVNQWRFHDTEALADYQQAVTLDPNNARAYIGLGDVNYFLGRYDEARADYDSAIPLAADPSRAYYGRGRAFYEQGDYAAAVDDFTSAINADRTLANAWLARAWGYLMQGDNRASADFLRWLDLTRIDVVRQPLDEALAGGDLTMREGLVYRLRFEGQAGQVFSAAVKALIGLNFTDPLLVLLGPDGTPLVSDDDGGVNLNSLIRRFTLPQTGTYILVFGQAGLSGSGTAELAVSFDGVVRSTNPDDPTVADMFAVYNLFVGDTAEVFTTGGDHLNLRSGAGTINPVVARLERGTLVTLLDGPRKEGAFVWWNVQTADGTEGWAVERAVEEEQTLQLALLVGEDAIVSSSDRLNVRGEPSLNAAMTFQLEDGARVTLLEAPVIVDNYRWWHIRDADGHEGWTVDRVGITRTLIPAREFRQAGS